MKIIVLAAGKGDRFKQAGFELDKPLIHLLDKPLIDYSLQIRDSYSMVVIGTPTVCEYVKCNYKVNPVDTISVRTTQAGPAMSVLLCGGSLDMDDEPVLLMDCDMVLTNLREVAADIETRFQHSSASAVVVGTEVSKDSWGTFSTIGWNKKTGCVKEIVEKVDRGLTTACIGIYAFRDWRTYVESLMYEVAYRNGIMKEMFMSDVIHSVLEQDLEVHCMEVSSSKWMPVGDPDQYINAVKYLIEGA